MNTVKRALAVLAGSAVLLVLSGSSNPRDIKASSPSGAKSAPISSQNSTTAAAKANVIEALQKSPMSFEENRGQTDERVLFMSRGQGYSLFLTRDRAVMALRSAQPSRSQAAKGSNRMSPGMPYVGNPDAGVAEDAGTKT